MSERDDQPTVSMKDLQNLTVGEVEQETPEVETPEPAATPTISLQDLRQKSTSQEPSLTGRLRSMEQENSPFKTLENIKQPVAYEHDTWMQRFRAHYQNFTEQEETDEEEMRAATFGEALEGVQDVFRKITAPGAAALRAFRPVDRTYQSAREAVGETGGPALTAAGRNLQNLYHQRMGRVISPDVQRSILDMERSEEEQEVIDRVFGDQVLGAGMIETGKNIREALAADDVVREDMGFITGDVVGGLTSFTIYGLSFAASARAGGPLMAASLTGALASHSEAERFREDALAKGASLETADRNFLLGQAAGVLHVVPIGRAVGRMNQTARGSLYKTFDRVFREGSLRNVPVRQAAITGLEEGLKEVAVQSILNASAKDWLEYDPDRSLSHQLLRAGMTGGFVGATGGAIMGTLGRRLRFKDEAAMKKAFREERFAELGEAEFQLDPADPLNFDFDFFGHMMTPEELSIRARRAQTQQELETAVEAEQEAPQVNLDQLEIGARVPAMERRQHLAEPARQEIFDFESNVRKKPLADINPRAETYANIGEALDAEGVAFVGEGTKRQVHLNGMRLTLQELQRKQEQEFRTENVLEIQNLREDIAKVEALVEQEQNLISDMTEFAGRIVKRIAPDMKVLLGDGGLSDAISSQARDLRATIKEKIEKNLPLTPKEEVGLRYLDYPARLNLKGKLGHAFRAGKDTYAVEIDLAGIIDQHQGRINRSTKQQLMEVLSHEIGHTLGYRMFLRAPENVRRAVLNEYNRWVEEKLKAPIADFLSTGVTTTRKENLAQFVHNNPSFTMDTPLEAVSQKWGRRRSYFLSLHEYLAEQSARFVAKKELGLHGQGEDARDISNFVEEATKSLRDTYNATPRHMRQQKTFDAWLNDMSARADLTNYIERNYNPQGDQDIFAAVEAVHGKEGIQQLKFLREESSRYNSAIAAGTNLVQQAKMNPSNPFINRYKDIVQREWYPTMTRVLDRGHETLTAWRHLGKARTKKLADALVEETVQGTYYSEQMLRDIYGLDTKTIAVKERIAADMRHVLEKIEEALIEDARRDLRSDPVTMEIRIEQIQQDMEKMKQKPYFPLKRFGRHTVTVRNAEGKVKAFYATESKRQRRRLERQVKRELEEGDTIHPGLLSDNQRSFSGLPVPVLQHLKNTLKMDPEQVQELDQIINEMSPAESFRKHLVNRKNIHGFSNDVMRSYAAYMFTAGKHIARIRFGPEMSATLSRMNKALTQARKLPNNDTSDMTRIHDWMKEHHDYIMNPPNEWTSLRGLGFFWYLGFNAKSAVVNTTQTALLTYPYLGELYGDTQAVGAIAKATKDLTASILSKKALEPELQAAIRKAQEEGIIDQSLANSLATLRQDSVLSRALPVDKPQVARHNTMAAAAFMFHQAEKLNRRIAFISAYRLAKADGVTEGRAYERAYNTVVDTQFEYSRWNRPPVMRGKKGTIFLFMNYMQNAMFHLTLSRDPGRTRHLLMLMLISGGLGMPLAEDMIDLASMAVTRYKRWAGIKAPKTDLKMELREIAKDFTDEPDLLLRGLASQSLGFHHMGRAVGVDFPALDIQGSTSLGRILPIQGLTREGQNFDQTFSQVSERAGGAVVGGLMDAGRTVFNRDLDLLRRSQGLAPVFARNALQSQRWLRDGAVKTRAGEIVAPFDVHDPLHVGELVGKSLSFQPRRVNRGWEQYIATKDAVVYYETQRRMLLESYRYAKFELDDREAIADVWKAIDKYNDQVPYPGMGISTQDLNRSVKAHERRQRQGELGLQQSPRMQELADDIEEVFRQPER